MKKKVLIISRLFPSEVNPVKGIFVKNLLDIQSYNEQFEFTVFSPIPYTNKLLSSLFKSSKRWENHSNIIKHLNYNVHYHKYLKVPGIGYFFEWITILISVIYYMTKKRYKPDVIHTHWLYPEACATILIGKIMKKKVVVHHHEAQLTFHTKHTLIRTLLKWLLPHADVVISVSENSKKELAEQLRFKKLLKNHLVMHNGVDIKKIYKKDSLQSKKELNFDTNVINLLSVGTLNYKKGHDVLINSLSLLRRKNPSINFHMHIVGSGNEEKALKMLVKELDLKNHITFYGNLDYKKINIFMNACDFFTLTSRHESFGIVFLEALVCGKPVLGTKTGGIVEFVKSDSGILVDVDDIYSTYKSLIKLFSNIWNREEISEYYSAQFNLNKFAEDINDLY